ncbi:MAG: HAMP domain-containing protein, partial [Anaerolineales bacterium]|nr:HAMP domain-containing protein [Anaerolineales bacterium]
SHNRFLFWFDQAPWRILLTGVIVALTLAALLMWQLMQAPSDEIATLVSTLAISSLLSLGLGYILYRRGWARFTSLTLTLILAYVWAALLTLFNVWVMAQQMFASEHDLLLSGVLLLFAGVIATSFGIFVAATVTDGLRQLAYTAQQLAEGNLTARVAVSGRDEVARVAESFNEMAVQLQQAARQREELDTLRRDLIAWTSHDLRTPLTSIRAMIEALHDGVVSDPETTQRYYRTIRNDVVALNSLIDDLFELAQLDTGGLVLEKSLHDLGDLVSDALESFRALAEQRGITLDGDIGADMTLVSLNAAKISRVLANLLSNALRYTPAQGRVHVAVMRAGNHVQVLVQDNGPGFNTTDLPRVFEQFYRGEQARSRATGGAGLGLAIARGIVEAHNGRIWAANGAAGGAIVGFELPLAK